MGIFLINLLDLRLECLILRRFVIQSGLNLLINDFDENSVLSPTIRLFAFQVIDQGFTIDKGVLLGLFGYHFIRKKNLR